MDGSVLGSLFGFDSNHVSLPLMCRFSHEQRAAAVGAPALTQMADGHSQKAQSWGRSGQMVFYPGCCELLPS